MSFIHKCDKCGSVYDSGFKGAWSKVVQWGSLSIDVDFKMRPPHLCKKCLSKFLPLMVKEIKGSYVDTKEVAHG